VLRHLRDAPTGLAAALGETEVLGHEIPTVLTQLAQEITLALAFDLVRDQQTATLGLVQLQGDHEGGIDLHHRT